MSKIVLSCGHEITNFADAYNVLIKSTDRRGSKAISYSTVCEHCRDKYAIENELFANQTEAYSWLSTDEW